MTSRAKGEGSRESAPRQQERLQSARQGGVFARKRVEDEIEDDAALQQARARAEKLGKRAEANSTKLLAIFNRWCGEEVEEGLAEDDDVGEGSEGGVAILAWRGLGMETVASFVLQVRRVVGSSGMLVAKLAGVRLIQKRACPVSTFSRCHVASWQQLMLPL